MKIGVHLPHIGRKATPEAEELGLADVWAWPQTVAARDRTL